MLDFLIAGSTFPKAKPQSGIWLAGLQGITRLVFLPLYAQWWIRETSFTGFFSVLFLYISVLVSMILMFSCRHDEKLLKVESFCKFFPSLFFSLYCKNVPYLKCSFAYTVCQFGSLVVSV